MIGGRHGPGGPDHAAGGARPFARRSSPGERRARHGAVEDLDVVLAAGLRFLEARARSIAETRRRLLDAGYRADLVEGAIDRLRDLDLLDDSAFARRWVESRDRSRPRGAGALRRELALRGVTRDVIDEALAARLTDATDRGDGGRPSGDESSGADGPGASGGAGGLDPAHASAGTEGATAEGVEESAARRLLDRRRRDLERVDDPRKRRARTYALLARNGFAPDLCARLAAEAV